jgi:hypothetical protein
MLLHISHLVELPEVVIASPVRLKALNDCDDLRCNPATAALLFDVIFELIRIVAKRKCGI